MERKLARSGCAGAHWFNGVKVRGVVGAARSGAVLRLFNDMRGFRRTLTPRGAWAQQLTE